MSPQIIYLLHFDRPIGFARHYLGRSTLARLEKRLADHAKGHGAALTREAVRRQIGFHVAQLWITQDSKAEQRLKVRSHYGKLCTICNPALPWAANHPIALKWSPRPQELHSCDYAWNWLP